MSYFPCPKCDGILDLKQAKNGSNMGEYFYGCTNFSNSLVNCKTTIDKVGILNYLHSELFSNSAIPQPLNGVLWSDSELNNYNNKQLAMICSNNGYDIGHENLKENLISFIKYYQTTYYKIHRGCLLFSKPINSDYILDFSYSFYFDNDENNYSDMVLDSFLALKKTSIIVKNFLGKKIGKASITRSGIEIDLSESISNSKEYELLTVVDIQKTNCKSFVVSGEATLDLFNSEEELFLETFLANN